MRIVQAEVLVTSPSRNFVTLRLTTDDGVTGLGDATLNGRELAVASYLSDHVAPLLIDRDPHRIEDTWQFLYRSAYWRRGPVTMAAIAAVDMALWDIKGKSLVFPSTNSSVAPPVLGYAPTGTRPAQTSPHFLTPSVTTWTSDTSRSVCKHQSPVLKPFTGWPPKNNPQDNATTTNQLVVELTRRRRTGTLAPTCATYPPCLKQCATSSVRNSHSCTTVTTG